MTHQQRRSRGEPHSPVPDPDPAVDRTGVLLLIWTIFTAKAATLVIIVWAARSPEAGALVALTSLPWVFLAVMLASGPLVFRYRLRRVRARREALRRAEWMLADGEQAPAPSPLKQRRSCAPPGVEGKRG